MKKLIKKSLARLGLDLTRYDGAVDRYTRLYSKYRELTMVPEAFFVWNLALCEEFKSVEGTYVECGVWKGGMSGAIAELLGSSREVHLFDSFEGLPQASEMDGQAALEWQKNTEAPGYFDNCKTQEEFAIRAMQYAGHFNFTLHKGWFEKTLPLFDRPIGILRLDGDWYESTMECLRYLYPRVVRNGLIIIDDYYAWEGCARAVHDYLAQIKSSSRIRQINGHVAYIKKED